MAQASLALARRFAAGATMWCCAPAWPFHAQHVAVEFVHPVVMGKRAFPAAPVEGPGLIGSLRVLSRPGDILLAVAASGDPEVAVAVGRGRAWGLSTVWIGAGPRPEPGSADHVLWLEDERAAPYAGRLVRLYHLLWELTHVCLEHPGLLETAAPAPDGEVCVTCSDEGRPGEVVSVVRDHRAQVRTASGLEAVDTTLVGEVRVGDLVLVHAGSAVSVVEEGAR